MEKQYIKLLVNSIYLEPEYLTQNEKELIKESYILFKEKLSEVKELEKDNRKLRIEIENLKIINQDLFDERKMQDYN